MPTASTFSRRKVSIIATAVIALVAGSVSASAQPLKSSAGHLQFAAQSLKAAKKGPGPANPIPGPRRILVKPTSQAEAYGCHDHQSQTSYEGPCDQYDIKGSGCESEAELASVPGNCPNSSEP